MHRLKSEPEENIPAPSHTIMLIMVMQLLLCQCCEEQTQLSSSSGCQALQFLPPQNQKEHSELQTHIRKVHGQEAQAKRPQVPSGCSVLLPWGEACGTWYFTGLNVSSSPRFVMLFKGFLCCNITSLYREIVLSNGFCRFFKGIFILSFIGIELKQN